MTAELPGVSYVMPVLNEAGYLESAIRSIQAQEYSGPAEIVLALGPSTDGTDAVVRRLRAEDPRIRTVDNPRIDIPVGLNLAVRAARHPVLVRVDAHAELPAGYTDRAVRTLLERGAATVGGVMVAVGRPGLQAAVARAYNSPFGLGGGRYHSRSAGPGVAESAYLGVMRTDAVTEVGLFDETLRRGEDWELNARLRAAGHEVWLEPALRVTYWPRSRWRDLARQFWATGVWRGELVRRSRRHPMRYFAPPALVCVTAAAALLGAAASTRPTGSPGRVGVAACGPACYAVAVATVAARGGGTWADRARLAGALATMHYTWGTGFLLGVVRGAHDSVDTSRAARRDAARR